MYTFDDLKQILERLRDKENGCPWDSVQTHESMKKYLVEECGEVLEPSITRIRKICARSWEMCCTRS